MLSTLRMTLLAATLTLGGCLNMPTQNSAAPAAASGNINDAVPAECLKYAAAIKACNQGNALIAKSCKDIAKNQYQKDCPLELEDLMNKAGI